MPELQVTLNSWQDRLSAHFQSLHDSAQRGTRPIFALEHGLDDHEVSSLTSALQEHIRWSQPARGHWLAWTVFSAEMGYKFAGDQYWQTFSHQLPGWDRNEDRYYIRDSFRRFHELFGGAKPSGAWANNFTIISWPIANAVLPKDLQRHLASVLYEVRHLFTKSLIEDPQSLGELIERHSLWTSSRFRQFASEHELVGRIAAALLSPEEDAAEALLSLSTLKRITLDLQREQRSKDQLDDARSEVSSLTFRGVRPNHSGAWSGGTSPESRTAGRPEATQDISRPEFQTRILLAQTADREWSLKAILPDFQALLQSRPQFALAFTRQRSFVNGADRPFFPAKFLLCGRRPITITTLPDKGKPFVSFEEEPRDLTTFLEAVCRFPNVQTMLFRITDDNSAIRMSSVLLRPGGQYVLVRPTEAPSFIGLQGAYPVTISCAGLKALQINVPTFVSRLFQEEIAKLGLGTHNGLDIAPVGFPATKWDREGTIKWAKGSPLLLNVTSNFEVRQLTLELSTSNGRQSATAQSPGPSGTIFDLENLEIGEYGLEITAIVPERNQKIRESVGISIIPPSEASWNLLSKPAFAVLASPPAPTLEELWAGTATVDLYGSAALPVECRFKFYADAEKRHCLLQHLGPGLSVPLLAEGWARYLEQAKKNTKVSNAFDAASICSVSFSSPGLGVVSLDCEREFIPFRMKVKHSSSSYKIHLLQIDTTDSVSLEYVSFHSPNKTSRVMDSLTGEVTANPSGGLYAARRNDITSAIVIPPARLTSLADIQFVATRLPIVKTAEHLTEMASAIKLWDEAQLIGDLLSSQRRQAALLSLRTCFIESVCGAQWVALEENISHGRASLAALSSKLGDHQFSFVGRAALSGSRSFLEMPSAEIIDHIIMMLQKPGAQNDRQCLTILTAYLRFSYSDLGGLPFLPIGCSSFALLNPSLLRLMRFAIFAKEYFVNLEVQRRNKDRQ